MVLTETSAERAAEAAAFLRQGDLSDRARIEVGDAFEIADRLEGPFDVVFNDVDKERYPEVLDVALSLLPPGGLLICDNMLWFGTVLEEDPVEPSTRGIKELTRRLYAAEEFSTTLITMRDGLTVSIRRP